MENSTDGNLISILPDQARSLPAGIAVFLFIFNTFFSIAASLGNALMLNVLRKVSSLHPPTKLLFVCLAATDLCIGFLVQPLFATTLLNSVIKLINVKIVYYLWEVKTALNFILCGVSVFTSTAISVDRLLALTLGLRYRHIVTLTRVRAIVVCFWLLGVLGGLLYSLVSWRDSLMAAIILTLICVFISVIAYTKIFLTLRQNQIQMQEHIDLGQPNGGVIPLNITRYTKTVSSIALVQLALVVCFVPFTVVFMSVTNKIALDSTRTLFYLNSSLNPVVYYWKIAEVKQAIKDTLKQFCCLSN